MNRNLKTAIFIVFDILVYIGAWIFSTWILRLDLSGALEESWAFLVIGGILLVSLNFGLKIYSILLHYAGFSDALRIVCVSAVMGIYGLLVSTIGGTLVKEWAIISTAIIFVTTMASRYFLRFMQAVKLEKRRSSVDEKRVMIVGAGSAGSILIREMKTSEQYNMRPVCAIDDDPDKLNKYINGVKVVGDTTRIQEMVDKFAIDRIVIAIPSANKKDISRIVAECQKTKCKTKIIPGMFQFTNGQVSISDIKPVSIADLLGREQVKVNLNEIMGYIEGKTVLVTGGGGSIGSELCRQIATHNPKRLIILDIYENNAYDIQQELVRNVPNLNLTVLIASVRDKNKIEEVFSTYSTLRRTNTFRLWKQAPTRLLKITLAERLTLLVRQGNLVRKGLF